MKPSGVRFRVHLCVKKEASL